MENLDLEKLKKEILVEVLDYIGYDYNQPSEQVEESSTKKYPIKYVGDEKIFLNRKDRTDPMILLILAIIEEFENRYGGGYDFLDKIVDKYKFSFSDPKLYRQLEDILFYKKNKKQ